MERPLRVAVDLRPIALPSLSGIGLLVTQILEEMSRRGVSFTGVSDRPLPPGRLPVAAPVRVEARPRGRIRWEARTLPRLLAAIEPRPDLYHATWNHGVPASLPFPAVLSLHDLIPWVMPRFVPWPRPAFLHRALYRDAVRRSAKEAAAIVTLSEASRRDIAARLPAAAAKTAVIPCAVPRWFRRATEEDAAASRARYGGAPYWLYLGGFDPRKGLGVLLDALAAAGARGAPIPGVVFAGAWNRNGERCRARAESLGLRAHFPGFVPDSELAALYAGASLFLYPSRYEGFGIPPLLAMAAGVPCVTGDGGALPEVVGDAGLVVPSGDVEAWAGAIAQAAAEPGSLLPLARAGPRRAATFSAEALAERTLRVYERAAASRGESA